MTQPIDEKNLAIAFEDRLPDIDPKIHRRDFIALLQGDGIHDVELTLELWAKFKEPSPTLAMQVSQMTPALKEKWAALTDQQRSFVNAYTRTGSPALAYREAYPNGDPKLDATNGYNLTRRTKIAEAIELIEQQAVINSDFVLSRTVEHKANALVDMNKSMVDTAVTSQWVLDKAVALASFNIGKFIKVDSNGDARFDFKDATDEDWYCIQDLDIQEGEALTKKKLKAYDKLRAIDMVGRHISINAFAKSEATINIHSPKEILINSGMSEAEALQAWENSMNEKG